MAREEKDKTCIDCSYWAHVKEMRVKCHVQGAGEAGKSGKITRDLYAVESSG